MMEHAKWIPIKKGEKGYSAGDFRCSSCGEPNRTWRLNPPFCSMCGAKMDLKDGQMSIFDFLEDNK